MSLKKAAQSQTQNVYSAIRADILACRLAPGSKLKIKDLCDAQHVSLGAVREALSRLTAEGLVVAEAQRGFQVAPVSAVDLQDLTSTRIEIESLCLSRAIANGTVEWEAQIIAAYHRLKRTPERASDDVSCTSAEWEIAHEAFHAALVSACDSAWLIRLRAMLYTQVERYRRLSVKLARADRHLDDEHHALMQAVLDRNTEQAKTYIAEHIGKTALIILETLPDRLPMQHSSASSTQHSTTKAMTSA